MTVDCFGMCMLLEDELQSKRVGKTSSDLTMMIFNAVRDQKPRTLVKMLLDDCSLGASAGQFLKPLHTDTVHAADDMLLGCACCLVQYLQPQQLRP